MIPCLACRTLSISSKKLLECLPIRLQDGFFFLVSMFAVSSSRCFSGVCRRFPLHYLLFYLPCLSGNRVVVVMMMMLLGRLPLSCRTGSSPCPQEGEMNHRGSKSISFSIPCYQQLSCPRSTPSLIFLSSSLPADKAGFDFLGRKAADPSSLRGCFGRLETVGH